MTTPKKQKTNADLAYEVQKFLKRLSIDLKFLKQFTLWTEGDSFCFGSQLDNFFILEGKLKIDEENELLRTIKSFNKPVKMNFENENFIALKKSLKKEVLGITSEENKIKIQYEKEPFNLIIETTEPFINQLRFIPGEKIEISSECVSNTRLEYFKENKKELEIPRKSIVGYTSGDFILERETNDEILAKSVLNYESDIAEFQLYFKSIK